MPICRSMIGRIISAGLSLASAISRRRFLFRPSWSPAACRAARPLICCERSWTALPVLGMIDGRRDMTISRASSIALGRNITTSNRMVPDSGAVHRLFSLGGATNAGTGWRNRPSLRTSLLPCCNVSAARTGTSQPIQAAATHRQYLPARTRPKRRTLRKPIFATPCGNCSRTKKSGMNRTAYQAASSIASPLNDAYAPAYVRGVCAYDAYAYYIGVSMYASCF